MNIFLALVLTYGPHARAVVNGKCLHESFASNSIERQIQLSSVQVGCEDCGVIGEPTYFFCSGTLTASRQVATAAHCLDRMNQPPPTRYLIEYKEWHGKSWVKKKVYLHFPARSASPIPYPTKEPTSADVAMLTLDGDVPAENITPPCDSAHLNSSGEFFAAGFGYVRDDKNRHHPVCYERVESPDFDESKIISRPYSGGASVCHGDSGGGVFYRSQGGQGQACLAGVVSGNTSKKPGWKDCTDKGARQIFPKIWSGRKMENEFYQSTTKRAISGAGSDGYDPSEGAK